MKPVNLPPVSPHPSDGFPSLTPCSVLAAIRAKPLFLVWPFWFLVDALRDFRNPHSKAIFCLFCVFFGFVFIYGDPVDGGADSARYAARLIEWHKSRISLATVTSEFYSRGSSVRDVYNGLATWMVSSVTGNPRWLFTFFAAVFGVFYSLNLWFIFDHIDLSRKVTFTWALIIILFALVNPIWNINGVRMWTALQIYSFGMLSWIINRDWKGIFWVSISPLFHFSFLFPCALALIFIATPKNLHVLIVMFFSCAFLDLLDLSAIRNLLSGMPDIFQSRVENYTSDSYSTKLGMLSANNSIHVQVYRSCLPWLMYATALFPYLFRKVWLDHRPYLKHLFAFALLTGSFAFLVDDMPSGGRMLALANFFLLGTFAILLNERTFFRVMAPCLAFFSPILSFLVIYKLWESTYYWGLFTLFGNFILGFIYRDKLSTLEFVKWLLGY